jgi:DNA-binding transcriptional ArsR family regulator
VDVKINPFALVFSLFGGYVLSRGVDIWTGSLIRALAPLGLSDRTVRTTISRMKHMGYLEGQRVGRHSFYRLTDSGLREVHGARDLAFGPLGAPWDGRWVLLTYSIPEDQRELRDSLRESLKAIGFGCLVPGVWISPHPLPAKMEKKWQKSSIWDRVSPATLFPMLGLNCPRWQPAIGLMIKSTGRSQIESSRKRSTMRIVLSFSCRVCSNSCLSSLRTPPCRPLFCQKTGPVQLRNRST